MRQRRRHTVCAVIAVILCLDILFTAVIHLLQKPNNDAPKQVIIPVSARGGNPTDRDCTFHSCFGVYQCGYDDVTRISVYVYPYVDYVTEAGEKVAPPVSREFQEMVEAVLKSQFYTSDPDKACLYLPNLDLLNQANINTKLVDKILASLPSWTDGSNHLLFNMLPGSLPDFNSTLDVRGDRALLAGGGFHRTTYRRGFDVSIPVYNPLTARLNLPEKHPHERRSWLLVSAQTGYHMEFRGELERLTGHHQRELLVLGECTEKPDFTTRCRSEHVYQYPQILQEAEFCMVIRGARLAQTALFDALKTDCIPIVVADGYVLPFSDVLDWKRAVIVLQEARIGDVMDIVRNISHAHVLSMRRQGNFYFRQYFRSISAITMTTLQILNDRVFPYASRKYQHWNEEPHQAGSSNPLFLPVISRVSQGFTAVVLTYDRQESLFRVIRQLSDVPSLVRVIVVWNNQHKLPPAAEIVPDVNVPVTFVQTRENKLSNRFYPFDQIETECILAIDDDIVMLTPDEIEFGYEVWREFPDRLVGFPSRGHSWSEGRGYRYETDWMSNFSLVLTGAAFHHKYYSYMYTYEQPGDIKQYVDEFTNCEDIAMNFLITNITGKPPIKVTPKQKFKCGDCAGEFGRRMKRDAPVSERRGHLDHRSECIRRFSRIYGRMPLRHVEFRADPVLYREERVPREGGGVPRDYLRYPNLGSI